MTVLDILTFVIGAIAVVNFLHLCVRGKRLLFRPRRGWVGIINIGWLFTGLVAGILNLTGVISMTAFAFVPGSFLIAWAVYSIWCRETANSRPKVSEAP
jgi:hypothetical protein